MELKFTDRFSGSRYGKRTPIGEAKGTTMHKKFETSARWESISTKSHYDEKNDNRTDVFRGYTFVYKDINNGKKVKITASHSNTGKTIHWIFTDEGQM